MIYDGKTKDIIDPVGLALDASVPGKTSVMPSIPVKQYNNPRELKEELKAFGIQYGYSIVIQRSRKVKGVIKNIGFGCDRGYCRGRANCRAYAKGSKSLTPPSKRDGCSFGMFASFQKGIWTLQEVSMVHNHEPSKDLKSHPARILTAEERYLVSNMTNAGASSRDIYAVFLEEDPNTFITIQDVWYERSFLPISPFETVTSPLPKTTSALQAELLPEILGSHHRTLLMLYPLMSFHRLFDLTKNIYNTLDDTNRQFFREPIMKFFSDEKQPLTPSI